jgi:hypothetical protein
LWLLLAPALRAIQSAHPSATLSLHVDDLSATTSAPSVEECCVEVADLAQTIKTEFQTKRGLAFAPDKGFVIASDPVIAKAAVQLTDLPVQPDTVVRRLGIDYHLEPAPSRRVAKTPVQTGRFKEAVRRVVRLRRFFPNGSAGLFAAGVGPVAYYGTDHIRMAPPLVQSLQKKAVASGQVRPFGTPAEFALLAHPTTYDPGYKITAQPILRWAREVWMSDHPATIHPDRLTAVELTQAQRMFSQRPPDELPQGPLAAIAGSLEALCWTAVIPSCMGPPDNPTALNMTVGSPTMLAHFVRCRYEELRFGRLKDRMDSRACPVPFDRIHWPLLGRFLRSKKTPVSSKSALLSALYGSFPSPLWLWRHGWKIDRDCIHCGRPLDLRHVLNGCEDEGLFQKFTAALTPLPVPQPDPDEGIRCMINGVATPWEQFELEPGRPVFTDGSATHVQYPEIAQAGAAVFQIDSSGTHRVAMARVPPAWPISAVTAEFLALDVTARALAQPYSEQPEAPATEVCIDCQAVVQALSNPVPFAQNYRSKFAGDLKHPHIDKLRPRKVRAHLSELVARSEGTFDQWYGNDKADRFANEARASIGKPATDYVKECSVRNGVLGKVADRLAEEMPTLRTIPKREKPPTAVHPTLPHHWVWHETRWCCLDCGRTARRRGPALLKSACRGPPDQASPHQSHRLSRGFVDHMPLTFCRDCGGYSTTRKGKLQQPCRPRASTILSRLRRGLHPSSMKPLRNVCPVVRITSTLVQLSEAVQSIDVPVLPVQPVPVHSPDRPWDDQDMAAAAEPFDHEADYEDQWAAAFEAAAEMGLEADM